MNGKCYDILEEYGESMATYDDIQELIREIESIELEAEEDGRELTCDEEDLIEDIEDEIAMLRGGI